MHNKVDELYEMYKRKNRRTRINYITLNVLIFTLSSFMVVLNLFIIRLSKVKDDRLVTSLFAATSILVALSTLLTTLITFFKFKHLAKESMKKIRDIKFLRETYKARVNQFENPETRDLMLVTQVTEILNKSNY